jgi:hypothetical protein
MVFLLKITNGCTQTTPTEDIHAETKILSLREHLDMRGTQFLAAATNDPEHPHHYMHIKNAPEHYYKSILHSIPPPTNDTYTNKHIHTSVTDRILARLGNNHVLGYAPPSIDESETQLHRTDRVHLARLRCGHQTALKTYQHKLDENTDNTCPYAKSLPHH